MNFLQFALKNVPIPSVTKILKSHESMFLALSCLQLEEESIPVGCVPPAFLIPGVSLRRPALEKDPPLERDTPLEGDPPRTEIPLWTETPPGQTDTHFWKHYLASYFVCRR